MQNRSCVRSAFPPRFFLPEKEGSSCFCGNFSELGQVDLILRYQAL